MIQMDKMSCPIRAFIFNVVLSVLRGTLEVLCPASLAVGMSWLVW